MEKLITVESEGAVRRYSVWDQTWTEAALEELRREHGVLFRADGVVPVLMRGKILTLGIEDDGVLSFGPDSPTFHAAYARSLAGLLTEAADALLPPPPEQKPREDAQVVETVKEPDRPKGSEGKKV